MADHETSNVGGILTAFTIGALAGAGIALLYAPYSGRETRTRLARRSRELGDRASAALEEAKHTIRTTKEQLVQPMQSGAEQLREQIRESAA